MSSRDDEDRGRGLENEAEERVRVGEGREEEIGGGDQVDSHVHEGQEVLGILSSRLYSMSGTCDYY